MVAVVTGSGLGLFNSSLNLLNAQNSPSELLNSSVGSAGNAYVNAATGNLILQSLDETLSANGADIQHLRTYNAQGNASDGDSDRWRWLGEKRVVLHGSENSAGSWIIRISGDGRETRFDWNGSVYLSSDGEGAHDQIQRVGSEWVYTEGSTQTKEYYNHSSGWISALRDKSGAGFDYVFEGNRLKEIHDAASAGQSLILNYDSNDRLSSIDTRSQSGGALTRQVYFEHDSSGRLTFVRTDLTPSDNSISDNNIYQTEYQYHGTSHRVSAIIQSDGTRVDFTYIQHGDEYKVDTLTDQFGLTDFNYFDGRTEVINGAGDRWNYYFDSQARITRVESALVSGEQSVTHYGYDDDDNLTSITDGENNTVHNDYDANGNVIESYDAEGNYVRRSYNANNQLISETQYRVASTSGTPSGEETSYFIYDAQSRLRYTLSPEGGVSETRYNAMGHVSHEYYIVGNSFNPSSLSSDSNAWEAQLNTWRGSQDLSQSQLTEYRYDYRGNLEQTRAYANLNAAGEGILNNAATVNEYVYSEHGQLLQTISVTGTQHNQRTTLESNGYDGLGRLTSTINSNGTTTTQYNQGSIVVSNAQTGLSVTSVFDNRGRLLSTSSDAANVSARTTRFYYDGAGRLRMEEDAEGGRTFLFYDHAGRITHNVDASGTVTEFSYDNADRTKSEKVYATALNTSGWFNGTAVTQNSVSVSTSADDRSTRYFYDDAGRLIRTEEEFGSKDRVSENTYDGASRLIQSTQGDRTSTFFYDNNGAQIGAVDAENYVVENQFDEAGRLVSSIRYDYKVSDSLKSGGNFANIKSAINSANPEKLSSHYFYDGQGRQVGSVDEQGFFSEIIFEPALRQTKERRYLSPIVVASTDGLAQVRAKAGSHHESVTHFDNYGRLSWTQSHDGTISRTEYNAAGQVTRTISAEGTTEERRTRTRYNGFSEVIGVVSGEGEAAISDLVTAIDRFGRRFEYDEMGRTIYELGPDGQKSLHFYDQAGRLTHVVNAEGNVSLTSYNAFGQVESIRVLTNVISTDGLSGGDVTSTLTSRVNAALHSSDAIVSTTYNQLGLVATQTDAENNTTTHIYDAHGELTDSIQSISGTRNVQTHFVRNKLGAVLHSHQDYLGINAVSSLTYDGFGRVATSTDANGNQISTDYFDNGRTIIITDALGRSNRTEVDAYGRTVNSYDALGNLTTYSYNDQNRESTVIHADGSRIVTSETRHGETLQVEDQNGNITRYTYTKDGQLDTVTDALGVVVTDHNYDDSGRLYESTDGNGTITRFAYDAADRVTTKTVDPDGLNIQTSYQFDGQGRQTFVTEAAGTTDARTTQYIYDRNGQIKQSIVDPNGLQQSTIFTYDGLGQTTRVERGTVSNPAEQVTVVEFDNLGRKTAERVDPDGLDLTKRYEYDKNGNLVRTTDANGNASSYVYDAADQIRFTIDAEGAVSENIYDDAGNIVRTVNYANRLDTSELEDLATLQKFGINRLDNSTFSRSSNSGWPEGWTYDAYNSSAYGGVNYASGWTAQDLPEGDNTVWMRQPGRVDGTAYQELKQTITGIEEGKHYSFSAYTGAHRATVSVHIVWYDADGRSLGATTENAASRNAAEQSGGASLTGYKRIVAEGTAPKGAVKAQILLRKNNTHEGQGDSYLFATHAQFEEVKGSSVTTEWAKSLLKSSEQDRTTNFVYDELNRLRFSVDAEGAVSENIYDAAGQVIRTINYAKKLSASERDKLSTINTIGINRLQNSIFSGSYANGAPEGWAYDAYNSSASVGRNLSTSWAAQNLPHGDNTVWLHQSGRVDGNAYQELKQTITSIEEGKQYSFSAYTGAHRATVSVHIVWYDADGRSLGSTAEDAASRNEAERSGGNSLSGYKRIVAAGTAPEGATKAILLLRKYNTNEGQGDSWLFAAHAQFEEGSTPSDWVKALITPSSEDRSSNFVYDKAGRLRFSVDASGSVSENIYDGVGNIVRTVQYANKLSASDVASLTTLKGLGSNRLINPTFDNMQSSGTPAGWSYGAYNSSADVGLNLSDYWRAQGLAHGDNTVWLHQSGRVDGVAYQELTQTMNGIEAGRDYTFSAYTAAHRATVSVHIVWYDANGKSLGSTAENAASRNAAELSGGNSLSNYKRIFAQGKAPEGAVKANVLLRKNNTHEGQGDSWLFAVHAQFEESVSPSDWFKTRITPSSDDRTSNFIYDKAGRLRFNIDPSGAVSENIYDARGNVVRTVAYANKLSASEVASLTTLKTLGSNRLNNSIFTGPLNNGVPEGWAYDAYNSSATAGVNLSDYWSVQDLPSGDNTVWLRQVGRVDGTAYQELKQTITSIEAGKDYSFSAYTGAHRATVSVHIVWYDANGNSLGSTAENTASRNVAEQSGGPSLPGYKRIVAAGTAPEGATKAVVLLRKNNTHEGQGDSWLFAAHAQFEETSTPSDWVKALIKPSTEDRSTNLVYDKADRLRFTVDAAGAVSESIYDSVGNLVRTVQYANKLSASDIAGLGTLKGLGKNRLINPTFDNLQSSGTPEGWSYGAHNSSADVGANLSDYWSAQGLAHGDNTVWLHQSGRVDGVAYQELTQSMNGIEAGRNYTFSAYTGAHRATVSVHIVWYDANGNSLGSTAENAASRNVAEQSGGPSLPGYKRIVAQGKAPEGAVRANVLLRKNNTHEGQGDSWLFALHAQFEESASPSDWVKTRIAPSSDDRSSNFVYDKAGRLRFSVDSTGAVSENVYDATGNVVRTVAYANKLSASEVASLTTLKALGSNRLNNSIFTGPLNNGVPEGWAYDAYNSSATAGVNLSDYWSAQDLPSGDNTVWLRQVGRVDGTAYQELKQTITSIEAGKDYSFSAYTGAHRATVSVHIVWYDTNGNSLGSTAENTASRNVAEQSGGPSLPGYKRIVAAGTAPEGATKAVVLLRKNNTHEGQGDSWLFAAHAQFEEASTPSDWVKSLLTTSNDDREASFVYDKVGRLRFNIDAEGAVTENIYNALGNVVRTVNYANKLSESERASVQALQTLGENRLRNATFDNLQSNGVPSGWSYGAYNSSADVGANYTSSWTAQGLAQGDNTVWLHQSGRVDGTAYQQLSQTINDIEEGKDYTFSAYTGAHRATVSVHIVWYDAQGRSLGSTTEDAASRNEAERSGGNSLSGYKRIVAQGKAPEGAVKATTLLRKYNTDAGQGDSWLFAAHAQFEEGEAPSDWVKALIQTSDDDRATNFVYDNAGRLRFSVDASGAVTENIYDAMGQVIRSVNYANRLSANDVTSLTQLENLGANSLVNSTFDRPQSNGVPEGWFYGAHASSADVGVNLSTSWAAQGLPSGDNTVWLHQSGRVGSTAYQQLAQNIYGIEAGKDYSFSAYTGAHRAMSSVHIVWYDANGNSLGSTSENAASRNDEERSGGNSLSGYKRIVAQGKAPTGAVRAMVLLRKYDTDEGDSDSWLFAAHAQFEETPANGSAREWTKSLINPSSEDRRQQFVYDTNGRVAYTIDALGYVTHNTYDSFGQVSHKTAYNRSVDTGRIYSYEDLAGYFNGDNAYRRWQYRYDALGNLVAEITPDVEVNHNGNISNGHILNESIFNRFNEVVARREGIVVQLNGEGDISSRNESGIRTSRYVYDQTGRLRFTVDAQNHVTENFHTTFNEVYKTQQYDNAASGLSSALQLDITDVDGAVSGSGNDRTTEYAYDQVGRLVYQIDGSEVITKTEYNRFGDVSESKTYSVDAGSVGLVNGRRDIAALDSYLSEYSLGDGSTRGKAYEHDQLGRVERTTDAMGYVESNQYDAFGNRTSFTDKSGSLWSYEYNSLNQLTREISPQVEVAGINSSNNPTYASRKIASETTYNAFGEAVAKHQGIRVLTDSNGNITYRDESEMRTLRSVYDQLGRMAFSVDGENYIVQNHYDYNAQAYKITRYANQAQSLSSEDVLTSADIQSALQTSSYDRTTEYVYDKHGQTIYTIEGGSRLSEQQYNAHGQASASLSYNTSASSVGVNASGQRDAAALNTRVGTRTLGTQDTRGETYQFNALGQITRMTDALNNYETYTYDAFGNRETFTNKRRHTWTYEYDLLNRLTREITPDVEIAGYSGASKIATDITYDNFGNVRTRTEGTVIRSTYESTLYARETEYRYDALNRQTRSIDAGYYDSAAGEFVRDSYSIVYGSSSYGGGGSTTIYHTQRQTEVVYDELGNAVANHVYTGNGNYVSMYKTYDAFGRVVYEVDAEKYVTKYRYNAFGQQAHVIRYGEDISFSENAANGGTVSHTTIANEIGSGTNNRTIMTEYDQRGNKSRVLQDSVKTYSNIQAAAKPSFSTGEAGLQSYRPETQYQYNAFGENTKEHVRVGAGSSPTSNSSDWRSTHKYYDVFGQERVTVDGLNYATYTLYDIFGNIERMREYANSAAVGSSSPNLATSDVRVSDNSRDRVMFYVYDEMNQQTEVRRMNFNYNYWNGSSFSNVNVSTYGQGTLMSSQEYDAVGNVGATVQAGAGSDLNRTVYEYNALGQVTKVTMPSRSVVKNENSDPIADALDPFLSGSQLTVTPEVQYTVDVFGNITREYHTSNSSSVRGESRYIYHEYDFLGNEIRTTDAEGKHLYREYDIAGRVREQRQVVRADYVKKTQYTRVMRANQLFSTTGGAGKVAHTVTIQRRIGSSSTSGTTSETITLYRNANSNITNVSFNRWGIDEPHDVFAVSYNNPSPASTYLSWRDAYITISYAEEALEENDNLYTNVEQKNFYYDKNGNQTATLDTYRDGSSTRKAGEEAVYNAYGEVETRNHIYGSGTAGSSLGSISRQTIESFVFDKAGRITSKTAADGTTAYYYDLIGNATVQIQNGAAGTSDNRITEWVRDLNGRVKQERLQSFEGYTDGSNITTGSSETLASRYNSTTTLSPTIYRYYDRWGNTAYMRDQGGLYTYYTYDHNNNAISERQYIKVVDLLASSNTSLQMTSSNVKHEHKMYYDKAGRAIGEEDLQASTVLRRRRKVYDKIGQLTDEYNAEGARAAAYAYDAFGNRVAERNGIGRVKIYDFDRNGNMTDMYLLRLASTPVEGRFSELRGRYESGSMSTDKARKVHLAHYEYDDVGRRITETEFNYVNDELGATKLTYHDARGNIIRTVNEEGVTVNYRYDTFGRKASETNGIGHTKSWIYYNGYDSPLLKEFRVQAEGTTKSTFYTYNDFGQMKTEGATSSTTDREYEYYDNGLLQSVTDSYTTTEYTVGSWNSSSGFSFSQQNVTYSKTQNIHYDIRGSRVKEQVVQTRQPQGASATTQMTYSTLSDYDERGQLVRVESSGSDSNLARLGHLTYGFDVLGNRVYVGARYARPSRTSYQTFHEWYKYDNEGRVKLEKGTLDSTGNIGLGDTDGLQYTYDNAGRVVITQKANRVTHGLTQPLSRSSLVNGNYASSDPSQNRTFYLDRYGYTSYGSGGGSWNVVGHDLISYNPDHPSINGIIQSEQPYGTNNSQVIFSVQGDGGAITDYTWGRYSYDDFDRQIEYETAKSLSSPSNSAYETSWSSNYTFRGFQTRHEDGEYRTFSMYGKDGRLLTQSVSQFQEDVGYYARQVSDTRFGKISLNGDSTALLTVDPDAYDAAGNLKQYEATIKSYSKEGLGATISTFLHDYEINYEVINGEYKIRSKVLDARSGPYTSTRVEGSRSDYSYDRTGNLIKVDTGGDNGNTQKFIHDFNGRILSKEFTDEDTTTPVRTTYFYQGANMLGSVGTREVNLLPNTAHKAAPSPSSYTVNGGETLLSLAHMFYGDSSLWYLIADSNGLNKAPSEAFDSSEAGKTLKVPNVSAALKNTAENFKPYNPGEIVSDTTPTMVVLPPPKPACNYLAMIIIVVIAVVVTVVTAGAAGPALAGALGNFGATVAAGAIGGMAGNAAGQLAGMAMGVQSGFDFKAMFASGIAGAITAGIGYGLTNGAATSGTSNTFAKVVTDSNGAVQTTQALDGATRAVTQLTTVGQAIQGASAVAASAIANKAVGLESGFSWRNVAAGALSGAVTGALGLGTRFDPKSGKQIQDGFFSTFGRSLASSAINAGIKNAFVSVGGTQEWKNLAVNAFGDALANSLVAMHQKASQSKAEEIAKHEEKMSAMAAKMNQELAAQNEAKISGMIDKQMEGKLGNQSVPAPTEDMSSRVLMEAPEVSDIPEMPASNTGVVPVNEIKEIQENITESVLPPEPLNEVSFARISDRETSLESPTVLYEEGIAMVLEAALKDKKLFVNVHANNIGTAEGEAAAALQDIARGFGMLDENPHMKQLKSISKENTKALANLILASGGSENVPTAVLFGGQESSSDFIFDELGDGIGNTFLSADQEGSLLLGSGALQSGDVLDISEYVDTTYKAAYDHYQSQLTLAGNDAAGREERPFGSFAARFLGGIFDDARMTLDARVPDRIRDPAMFNTALNVAPFAPGAVKTLGRVVAGAARTNTVRSAVLATYLRTAEPIAERITLSTSARSVVEVEAALSKNLKNVVSGNAAKLISGSSKKQLNKHVATSVAEVPGLGLQSKQFENLDISAKSFDGLALNEGIITVTDKDAFMKALKVEFRKAGTPMNSLTEQRIVKHLDSKSSFDNFAGVPGSHAEVLATNDIYNQIGKLNIKPETYDLRQVNVATYKVKPDSNKAISLNNITQGKQFQACSNCSGIIPPEVNVITLRKY